MYDIDDDVFHQLPKDDAWKLCTLRGIANDGKRLVIRKLRKGREVLKSPAGAIRAGFFWLRLGLSQTVRNPAGFAGSLFAPLGMWQGPGGHERHPGLARTVNPRRL